MLSAIQYTVRPYLAELSVLDAAPTTDGEIPVKWRKRTGAHNHVLMVRCDNASPGPCSESDRLSTGLLVHPGRVHSTEADDSTAVPGCQGVGSHSLRKPSPPGCGSAESTRIRLPHYHPRGRSPMGPLLQPHWDSHVSHLTLFSFFSWCRGSERLC